MPANAVYVGRPSTWGNPFKVKDHGRGVAVRMFKDWIDGNMPGVFEGRRAVILNKIQTLKGKYLVCWCELDRECHADILAEMAN